MAELTRREREQKRKKKEILAAALSIFAQKGYHGTTMAEISQVSEYPLGTIYKFFPGKEDIYQHLVVGKGLELGDRLITIFEDRSLSPLERLRESLLGNVDFFVENKEFIRIYISGKSNVDAPLLTNFHKSINKLHDKMIKLYCDLLTEGIETGEFRDFAPGEMATIFSGIVNSCIWVWLVEREDDSELAKRLERAFSMFTHGVCPGDTP